MQVAINPSVEPGAWYAGSPGNRYDVREVQVCFHGHHYKHRMYEVVSGNHQGDYILPADCHHVAERAA